MKKFRAKRNENNKGFSLIEVLAAIVLLGLIAAPFLQMIYSSYATNQKSKKYLAAADLCQTVLEGISAQTYEDMGTAAEITKSDGSKIKPKNGVGNYYFGDLLTNLKLYGVPASSCVTYGTALNESEFSYTEDQLKQILVDKLVASGLPLGQAGPIVDNMKLKEAERFVNESHKAAAERFGTDKRVYFKVAYSGYTFGVKITLKEKGLYYNANVADGSKYITVPIQVDVYDCEKLAGTFSASNEADYKLIQSSSTKIPNTRLPKK